MLKAKPAAMPKPLKIGARVQWNWMGRAVRGAVKKVYLRPVRKTMRGTCFIRNGSPEQPAYLVKSKAGRDVLKLHRELTEVKK